MEDNSNLSPEELKMLTIAFMGQHLTGDLKQLQSNIISSSSTLKANNLNPSQILNTIPSNPRPRPVHNTVNAGANVETHHPQLQPQNTSLPKVQQISFSEDSHLKEIISILKNIEQKLDNLKIS